jgi:Rit1 N-terminal domain
LRRRCNLRANKASTSSRLLFLLDFAALLRGGHGMSTPLTIDAPLRGWAQAEEIALVRRASTSLYARLRSIEWDARRALALHAEVAAHLPLYGNVRAGAWYVPGSSKRCFFKSADGHYSQWGVSTRRPNVAFLRDAVEAGGAVVVDVTRAGKVWPDALSKTLPMWCAIISALAAGLLPGDSKLQEMLYLHPSVPKSEEAAIRRLLPSILQTWQESGLNLCDLVPGLCWAGETDGAASAVVRCLWACADTKSLWEDGVPHPRRLGYFPILCVSASPPLPVGARSFVEADSMAVEGAPTETISGVLFPLRATGFAYVQGAGDDEESWSCGLTPSVFWHNRCRLLAYTAERQNAALGDSSFLDGLQAVVAAGEACNTSPARVSIETKGVEVSRTLRTARLRVVASAPGTLTSDTLAAVEQAPPLSPVLVLSYSLDTESESTFLAEASGTAKKRVSVFRMVDSRGKPDYKHAVRRNLAACLATLRSRLSMPQIAGEREGSAFGTILCDSGDGDWATAVAVAWTAWHCSPDLDSLCEESLPDAGHPPSVGKQRLRQIVLRLASERADLVLSRRSSQQLNSFFSSSAFSR